MINSKIFRKKGRKRNRFKRLLSPIRRDIRYDKNTKGEQFRAKYMRNITGIGFRNDKFQEAQMRQRIDLYNIVLSPLIRHGKV